MLFANPLHGNFAKEPAVVHFHGRFCYIIQRRSWKGECMEAPATLVYDGRTWYLSRTEIGFESEMFYVM